MTVTGFALDSAARSPWPQTRNLVPGRRGDFPGHREKAVGPLYRVSRPTKATTGASGGTPSARVPPGGRERAERRSRWHHNVLGGPADSGGQQVITDLGAHRDQPVGMPGESAFRHNQTAGRQTGEIAMKQMPMKGVKAGRNAE